MADDYFIGVHAQELERLREQHAAWKPETDALFRAAGFWPGQRLADLGSGPGFTALELGGLVGPAGSVLALDKASAFLDFLEADAKRRGLSNIRTLDADLRKLDSVEGPLDGAFCRFFLAFLVDDLDAVLATLHRSLKPGGVLAVMEYLNLRSATSVPPMRGFDAHTEAWISYYSRNGGDTAVGTRLPHELTAAGFKIISAASAGGIAAPSHRWWSWWGRLIADFGDTLAADGLMTHADLQQLRQDWTATSQQEKDAGAFIHTPILIQIVAQKTT